MGEGLRVASKRCKNCLFSEARLVPPERAKEIVKQCIEENRFFICHCSTYVEENPDQVCCRGFWDEHRGDIWPMRLAITLDVVEFVELDPLNDFDVSKGVESHDERD